MEAATQTANGTVEEIQGVVVEVAFPAEHLPEIYNALEVEFDDDALDLLDGAEIAVLRACFHVLLT